MKKELTITFVLLLLTFSRTSIPAVAGGLMYYAFFRNLNWKKSLLILLSFGCVAVFGLFVIKDLIQDGSFQTKFQIITESLDYYKTASLKRILFGTGFFETGHIMTYYAHNYFLMFLMETGVFGLLFLLATLFSLIKVTNGAAMIILFPFFIQVSTDSALFIPWFYVAMSFVVLFSTYHSSTHLFSKKQL
ncbi:MAG: O-antigen ligase family protein [Bacteroidales bacterium]|nr:O-antigen ligase family protein [Bacteroidales bacterium]